MRLFLLPVCLKYDCCGSKGYDRSVLNQDSFTVSKNPVEKECAG